MNDPAVLAFAFVAVLAVAAHFAFLGYLAVGGFLAWWWPRTLWLHAATVTWAVSSVVWVLPCPLTSLERWARAGAGMAPIRPDGFIAHYLTGVVYPAGQQSVVQLAVFAVVVVSWLGAVRRLTARRGNAAPACPPRIAAAAPPPRSADSVRGSGGH